MLPSSSIVPDSLVTAAILDVYRQLRDVRRIRFERGRDWSGDEAIYFRILITDDAARTRLRETMTKAAAMLESILNPTAMGLHVYYNVRSVSEQDALREKSWEDVLS